MDHAQGCGLPTRTQWRNLLVFAGCISLNYLAAPVTYVGVLQAPLCQQLGASPTVANLPDSLFLAATLVPLIMTWISPGVGALKRNLIGCFLLAGISTLLVPLVLNSGLGNAFKVFTIITNAGILGAVIPLATAYLWEAVARGTDSNRRGTALALAFGAGPFLAFLSSLGSHLLLEGKLGPILVPFLSTPIEITRSVPDFPGNFSSVYFVAAPILAFGALLSCYLVIPTAIEAAEPKMTWQAMKAALLRFWGNPLLRTAAFVTIFMYAGIAIQSNMSLFMTPAIMSASSSGDDPAKVNQAGTANTESPKKSDDSREAGDASKKKQYEGLANALRFLAKGFTGLFLGWLLTRTNPKTCMLLTGVLYAMALFWAIGFRGNAYVYAFAIYGAGELVGVYAPNYLMAATPKRDYRWSAAIFTLLMLPSSPLGVFFGWIVQTVNGESVNAPEGYSASFAVCAVLILFGVLLAAVKLPRSPRPQDD